MAARVDTCGQRPTPLSTRCQASASSCTSGVADPAQLCSACHRAICTLQVNSAGGCTMSSTSSRLLRLCLRLPRLLVARTGRCRVHPAAPLTEWLSCRAKGGTPGQGSDCHGARGTDCTVQASPAWGGHRSGPAIAPSRQVAVARHWRGRACRCGEHGCRELPQGVDLVYAAAQVPIGTIFRADGDAEEGTALAELLVPGQRALLAQGGRGGRGNASFKTARNT